MFIIMLSANKDSFTFFFLFAMPFIFCLTLLQWLRHPILHSQDIQQKKYMCLVSFLKRKHSVLNVTKCLFVFCRGNGIANLQPFFYVLED